jgi:hypothetical protein
VSKVSFSDIDVFFLPWARSHDLAVFTEAREEEVRTVFPVDAAGNKYQVWANPEITSNAFDVSVGAALLNLTCGKHVPYRVRKSYEFCVSVPLAQTESALVEAWRAVKNWEAVLSASGNA